VDAEIGERVGGSHEPAAIAGRGSADPDEKGASQMTKVLFVCMGNICRSPTAQGVFRKLVAEAGLEGVVVIESAGTHALPRRRAAGRARAAGGQAARLRDRRFARAADHAGGFSQFRPDSRDGLGESGFAAAAVSTCPQAQAASADAVSPASTTLPPFPIRTTAARKASTPCSTTSKMPAKA